MCVMSSNTGSYHLVKGSGNSLYLGGGVPTVFPQLYTLAKHQGHVFVKTDKTQDRDAKGRLSCLDYHIRSLLSVFGSPEYT